MNNLHTTKKGVGKYICVLVTDDQVIYLNDRRPPHQLLILIMHVMQEHQWIVVRVHNHRLHNRRHIHLEEQEGEQQN